MKFRYFEPILTGEVRQIAGRINPAVFHCCAHIQDMKPQEIAYSATVEHLGHHDAVNTLFRCESCAKNAERHAEWKEDDHRTKRITWAVFMVAVFICAGWYAGHCLFHLW